MRRDDPLPAPVRSPLTGGSDCELVRTIAAETLIAAWREQLGLDIRDELRGHEAITLYRCRRTGLRFFAPPDVAGSARLYARLQRRAWYYEPSRRNGGAPTPRWEYHAALREIAAGERVLEVGAGDGRFLALARAAGVDARGIELSPEAAGAACERGLAVDVIGLDDAAREHAGGFDAACAFQVLEHVAEPRPFLEAMIRLLRPSGRLILCVPNCGGYLAELDDSLLNMPPHHMLHWTAGAFAALEGLLPLALERVRYEPLAAHNVRGFVSALRRRATRRLPAPLARALSNRYTNAGLRAALRLGLRRLFRGHGLLVTFRRTAPAPRGPDGTG